MIQTNTYVGFVGVELGGIATIKEELPAPREALIKAGCAKRGEGV